VSRETAIPGSPIVFKVHRHELFQAWITAHVPESPVDAGEAEVQLAEW